MQAPEQELELPEDMALDGEAGADEAQEDAQDQDAPGAEADAPERFPEQPPAGADHDEDADGRPADPDAEVAGPQEPEEGAHASEQQEILEPTNCGKGYAPGCSWCEASDLFDRVLCRKECAMCMGMRLCRGSLCQCDMHADDGLM